jgi:hypothetical protein
VNNFQRLFYERTLATMRLDEIVRRVIAGRPVPMTVITAVDLLDDASKQLDEAVASR